MQDAGMQVGGQGRASFASREIPVAGPPRDVVDEELEALGETLRFTAVTVGNPHCVIHGEHVTPARLRARSAAGAPSALPEPHQRAARAGARRTPLRIEIWERGAGYTLASGSSSCAAAAASVRLGHCSGDVTVSMPGGNLSIGGR